MKYLTSYLYVQTLNFQKSLYTLGLYIYYQGVRYDKILL